TKDDSPQTSTERSQEDPGAEAARERLKLARDQMLDALNDPEAVKRGEKRFEDGIDIIITAEDWEALDAGAASEDRKKTAAALMEIFATVPERQVRRVGWGWWYELQGTEPEPDDEHYLDWKLDILFEESMREVFPEAEREPTQEERG